MNCIIYYWVARLCFVSREFFQSCDLPGWELIPQEECFYDSLYCEMMTYRARRLLSRSEINKLRSVAVFVEDRFKEPSSVG